MVNVFLSGIRPVLDLSHTGTGGELHALHSTADQRLDLILHTVRQFITISIKELDTVKLDRIVGS